MRCDGYTYALLVFLSLTSLVIPIIIEVLFLFGFVKNLSFVLETVINK